MNPVQVVISFTLNSLAAAGIVPQPRQNIWVTLAKTLQQENICLSTAAARDPMSTCLVGVPLQTGEYPVRFSTPMPNPGPNSYNVPSHCHRWAVMIQNPLEEWLPNLPRAVQYQRFYAHTTVYIERNSLPRSMTF